MKKIVTLLILILLASSCFAVSVNRKTFSVKVTGIKLFKSTIITDTSPGLYWIILGQVTNNGKKPYTAVDVKLSYYAEGKLTGVSILSPISYTEVIYPGETSDFEQMETVRWTTAVRTGENRTVHPIIASAKGKVIDYREVKEE